MNKASKIRLLREILDTDLDKACTFMVQVNKTVKRLEDHRCLLSPKRDQALKILVETYDKADMLLKNLHKSTEKDILDIYRKKEALLVSDINELVKVINETAEVCGKIEEALEFGKENTLLQYGQLLEDRIEKLLLKGKPTSEAELTDIMELEFLPNEGIKQRFSNTALLGYVKRMHAGPEDICSEVDVHEDRPFSIVPQKRPIETRERKRAIVSRGALQDIKNHIKSNQLINQHVADAMIKEELPSPPNLKKSSGYPSPSDVKIKQEPRSSPSFSDHIRGTTFVNETVAESLIKEELPQYPDSSEYNRNKLATSFTHSFSGNLQSNTSFTVTAPFGSTSQLGACPTISSNKEMLFSSTFGGMENLGKGDFSKEMRKDGRYIPPALRSGPEHRTITPEKLNTDFIAAETYHPRARVIVNKCDSVQNWRQPRDTSRDKKRRLIDPMYWENNLKDSISKKEVEVKDVEKKSECDQKMCSANASKADVRQWEKPVASLCEAVSEVKLHTASKSKPPQNVVKINSVSPVSSNAWNYKIKAGSFKFKDNTGEKCLVQKGSAEVDHYTKTAAGKNRRMRFPRTGETGTGNRLDNNHNSKTTTRLAPNVEPISCQFWGFGVGSAFQFQFVPDESEITPASKETETNENSNSNDGVQSTTSLIDKNLKCGMKEIKTEFIRKIGKSGVGSLNFPIGVTATVNKNIVICNSGAHCVKIFDWIGTTRHVLHGSGLQKFNKPSAVIADEKEDLYIKDNKHIWVFRIDGTFVRKFGNEVLRRPYGLSFNSEGNLVVLNYDYREVDILIFSKTGDLLKKSMFTPISNFDLRSMSRCRFLDIMPSEDIVVVSDLGLSEIFVTDLNGGLMARFGEFGSIPGQFREPSGIAIDVCGNLVIADSKNDRIQVYNRGGYFVATILLEKERAHRPSDIFLTADGYLLVSNLLGHSVNIYKIGDCSF